ncbi:DNA repair protein-like protein Rhp26/Rad26 [Phyllosticta citribraziliensis]|uniref:DNA repair protein-like protein Rhp26/Rad26 n=1 Tax=Phyllosticta citribraziliensis TaxID=989973 RepID=A0ABR1M8U1_9PEZI
MSEPLSGDGDMAATPTSPPTSLSKPSVEADSTGYQPPQQLDKGKARAQNSPEPEQTGLASDDEDANETGLQFLSKMRNQDDLERDIGRDADKLLIDQADERDNKRMNKALEEKEHCVAQMRQLEEKLRGLGGFTVMNKLREKMKEMVERFNSLNQDIVQIEGRIAERHQVDNADALEVGGNKQQAGESRRDFLIRTGKITPFSRMPLVGGEVSGLGEIMMDAETELASEGHDKAANQAPVSHRNLTKPGFKSEVQDGRSKSTIARDAPASVSEAPEAPSPSDAGSDEAYEPDLDDKQLAALGECEDEDEDDGIEDDEYDMTTPGRKKRTRQPKSTGSRKKARIDPEDLDEDDDTDMAGVDDGDEDVYQARLRKWVKLRSEARRQEQERRGLPKDPENEEEWTLPHPTIPDEVLGGDLKVPGDIYQSLFDYQKTGVQWLYELYGRNVGGIIGDEMGLGKTIQLISFLAALHYSKKLTKPVIVICPATVMKQWVNEFHQWWPALRVSILHASGSGMIDMKRETQVERSLDARPNGTRRTRLTKAEKAIQSLVDKVETDGHVLVTTYSGLQQYAQFLLPVQWGYAVLDEGHKIRNPNARITIFCKELQTANRMILSGTPMQNNLTELWSLFDFVFPMRLGTLVDFRNSFEVPIKTGGYANASNFQVETARRCAEVLKEMISGYLLQRFKVDVAADLPKKTERVLFCRLTKIQREKYEEFLDSNDVKSIFNGKRQALYGIDILRKITNHPDLTDHKIIEKVSDPKYGSGSKSGKMQVVKELLQMWSRRGHKTLLFAQHRIMLDILEKFVRKMDNINFLRMDGTTAIKDRQDMVDRFNNDADMHVFLLTTKVGGLGVNLTGADRVIIYDPDWNPSTDLQARERAWRLGQKREVEIYRLMTAGTIEEKIYHRQIFKQFLSNKILKDPTQRQTFDMRDLYDLFSLGDTSGGETETSSLFKGAETRLSPAAAGGDGKPGAEELQAMGNIYGIARGENFYEGPEGETGASSNTAEGSNDARQPEGATKDERLLNTIFARSGVSSSLNHDSIIGGNSKLGAEPNIIAREAKKIADEAARELQRARDAAPRVPIGTVTWTGEYGTAGRPASPPPFRQAVGMQRNRNGSAALSSPASSRAGTPVARASSTRRGTPLSTNAAPAANNANLLHGDELAAAIKAYLASKPNGLALSKDLTLHFKAQADTREFRAALEAVAVFERDHRGQEGRGKWMDREEWERRQQRADARERKRRARVEMGAGRGRIRRG